MFKLQTGLTGLDKSLGQGQCEGKDEVHPISTWGKIFQQDSSGLKDETDMLLEAGQKRHGGVESGAAANLAMVLEIKDGAALYP